jgi:hypothetical protein
MAIELSEILGVQGRDWKKVLPPDDIYKAKRHGLLFAVVKLGKIDEAALADLTLAELGVAFRRFTHLVYTCPYDVVLFGEDERDAVRALSGCPRPSDRDRVASDEKPDWLIDSVMEEYFYRISVFVSTLAVARRYGPSDYQQARLYMNDLYPFARYWSDALEKDSITDVEAMWDKRLLRISQVQQWLLHEEQLLQHEASKHSGKRRNVTIRELLGTELRRGWMNAEDLVAAFDLRSNRTAFRKRLERAATCGRLKKGSDYRDRKDRATGFDYNADSTTVRMIIDKARTDWVGPA